MTPTYLGDIDLTYDTLEHYGVKGMKWRFRKGIHKVENMLTARARKKRYVSSHLAQDREKGKIYYTHADRIEAQKRILNNGGSLKDLNRTDKVKMLRTPSMRNMYDPSNSKQKTGYVNLMKGFIANENRKRQKRRK